MYDSHPHERLYMRERLGNVLPFHRHYVFPNPYLPFSLFIQPLLAFDFHLLSPFILGMHSLHRTWGDGLLVRVHSSCFFILSWFLTFLFFLLCFALHFEFTIFFFYIYFYIKLHQSPAFYLLLMGL
jgi:hypothetical protein